MAVFLTSMALCDFVKHEHRVLNLKRKESTMSTDLVFKTDLWQDGLNSKDVWLHACFRNRYCRRSASVLVTDYDEQIEVH